MHKLLKIGVSALSAVVVVLSFPVRLAYASDVPTTTQPTTQEPTTDDAKSIWNNTRYFPSWVGTTVDKATDIIKGVADQAIDTGTDIATDFIFPEFNTARKILETAADQINNDNSASVTIKDSYAFIAKRQYDYPVKGWKETDYMFCYVDKNVNAYQPQQFGNFTVAPNTIFIIRDTNFQGVKAFSIPINYNNIDCYYGSDGGCFSFELNSPPNQQFFIDTSSGPDTYFFRGSNGRIVIKNNNYNTIKDSYLIDWYNNNSQSYLDCLGDGTLQNTRPLNDFECLLGNAYRVGYAQPIPNGYLGEWFLTSGYVNVQYPDTIINLTSNDTTNIDPKKPPVYVMPNDNPLSSGKTINNNTVNNYNDYGLTTINGSLHFDPDILAGALGGIISPDLQSLIDGVYSLQPSIGTDFSAPDIDFDYNYVDIISDMIDYLVVRPPSDGWQPPEYPSVNTSAFIPATYPTIPTATLPDDFAQDMGVVLTSGWDIFNVLDVLEILVPIIIMLLLWRFTGK